MINNGPASFGYQLSRSEGEWQWTAYDPSGELRAEGRAPSRAAAAACVIRALAEPRSNPEGETA